MATQVEVAINKAKSLLGSHAYDHHCQAFVRVCYEAAGIYASAGSARIACNKWKISSSRNNIPVGAVVYFFNSADGHAGIYLGGGQMIHAWGSGGVIISDIDICSNYQGWGWQGGKKPTGAGEGDYSGNEGSSTDSSESKSVELCSTSVVSRVTKGGKVNERSFVNVESSEGARYELHIINRDIDYVPVVTGSVKWTTQWCDSAGKLEFTVLKDQNIDITEGNVVIFKAENKGIFYGYLFEKSKSKNNEISCTAYDQLRYFKNKDTYCYKNKKMSDVVKMIAGDNNIMVSDNMTDTEYVIPERIEDNVSLFDIVKNARELTAKNINKLFVMYDDFGKINIKEAGQLVTDRIVDEKSAEDFTYKTSIDSDVYNRIQVYKDDNSTGNRGKYIYEDASAINSWGVLQYSVKAEDDENPVTTGENLLVKYNKKQKQMSIKGAFGDDRLRAGACIFVSMDVGDVVFDKEMFFITKAVHNFGKSYTCDLDVVERENLSIGEQEG